MHSVGWSSTLAVELLEPKFTPRTEMLHRYSACRLVTGTAVDKMGVSNEKNEMAVAIIDSSVTTVVVARDKSCLPMRQAALVTEIQLDV